MNASTPQTVAYFPLGLPLSAAAWERLARPVDPTGGDGASPVAQVRLLAAALIRRRPRPAVSAAELNILRLLYAAGRHVTARYLEQRSCTVTLAGATLDGRFRSLPKLRPALESLVALFPPAAVWTGTRAPVFLRDPTACRQGATELFLLAVHNGNPAAASYAELFDDSELERQSGYRKTLVALDRELAPEPASGLLGGSLLALLRAPVEASPHSLDGQLAYVRDHWGGLLPAELLQGILVAFAVLEEERTMRGFGGGPLPALHFGGGAYAEPEAFTPDADWMSNVVLIAKSVYVWLDQLSRRYGRSITRLDQIPDAELDQLARWGFSALWLIGLWERSPASQRIKQIMGNPEAVSSAYSLYDYVPAADLGGEAALAELQERCRRRGIRLGCDVVPNHTGLDSRWVREHPDWYVQVDAPPYPAYRYGAPDLSSTGEVGLFIEDGYWNHSDAAVVFKHVDRRDGRVRYLYHGNDGTHMPWNDTAQLNFLLPQVREAMIGTILHVARQFKVIRFDAAMTLAKKHFRRLWFPPPGGGAGVPSRAEHWMSDEDFERAFPVEFWREVVDRVRAEAPDTLLLAEAFWLMEGYFVRTLGMHRVYNSAFMNMLKMEENAKYRSVIKNVIEFNPEILKRFVNFMNNPDEATAVEQFGKSDKYFGVAVLLATMPGLPMFGHGQIEGFREKYGMEYRRAYWDETADEGFVGHHEAQIFPLLRRRYLFSGSADFELFDFESGGHVNEDVFAYSNRSGAERALVVYHNRHAETGGWLRRTAAKAVRGSDGELHPATTDLACALGLQPAPGRFCRFFDHRSGLSYLRRSSDLATDGLYLQLGPFDYHVFLDIREFDDPSGEWAQLHAQLEGRPAADLDREVLRLRLAPLLAAFRRTVAPPLLRELAALPTLAAAKRASSKGLLRLRERLQPLLAALKPHGVLAAKTPQEVGAALLKDAAVLETLAALKSRRRAEQGALVLLHAFLADTAASRRHEQLATVFLPARLLTHLAGPEQAAGWLRELLLGESLEQALEAAEAGADAHLTEQVLQRPVLWPDLATPPVWECLFRAETATFLGVHWHEGVRWFNAERFAELLEWLFFAAAFDSATATPRRQDLLAELAAGYERLTATLAAAKTAGYRVDNFLEIV